MTTCARGVAGGVVVLGVWAAVLGAGRGLAGEWPPGEFINSVGMKFVRIPAGEFRMGSTDEEIKAARANYPDAKADLFADERPAHKVRLTRAFLMGKHEVTVGQFRKFVEATGYKTEAETSWGAIVWVGPPQLVEEKPGANWRKPCFEQTDAHPVVCVSWNDARKFAEWLNGNDKDRPAGWVYRLPTEAEWEYAARGPKSLVYPWGNEFNGTRCNFAAKGTGAEWDDKETDDGFRRTAPVGSYSPKGDSPFGVCDMAGNVCEWCEDWCGAYGKSDQTDPTGPATGKYRVVRGGSWSDRPGFLRAADRNVGPPEARGDHGGFRLVFAPRPQ